MIMQARLFRAADSRVLGQLFLADEWIKRIAPGAARMIGYWESLVGPSHLLGVHLLHLL